MESSDSEVAVQSNVIDRSKDADHFIWTKGMILASENKGSNQYKILGHLGDGTFGRALKCLEVTSNKVYAVKVIRAVARYTESAKTEAIILRDLEKQGGCQYGIVYLKEWFMFKQFDARTKQRVTNMCLSFEPLG